MQEGNGIVYKAFGGLWEGETPDNFGYCGEYRDDESGLIYLRNRYYDPETGRFITEDPAKDGVNWYTYAGNDPVNFIDPWGLKAGDAFSSINEALADAYWCYYGVTAFTQLEQGAAVYQYSDIDEATGTVTAKYSYTAPVIDEPHQVKLEGCVNDIPEGGSLFGFWHTHPGYTDDMNKFAESFSDTDKGFINKYDTTTPFGLFTPQGNINVLLSQGEKFNIPNPNARPLYQTVLTDRDFKKLIPAEKLLLSLRYGNAYYEFFQTNAELVKQYPWYADNEAIENLEIVQIYKDPQKYIDFLVGK